VDPGKDKIGLAVVSDNLEVHFKDIVNSKNIIPILSDLLDNYNIDNIIIGDGTFSTEIRDIIEQEFSIIVHMIDEAYSTVQAERKYRQEKQNWFMRWFKWKPGCPLDDYVAVILAERYFEKNRQKYQ